MWSFKTVIAILSLDIKENAMLITKQQQPHTDTH